MKGEGLEIREKEERLERARAKQEALRNAGIKRLKEMKIDELKMKFPREDRKKLEMEERLKDLMMLKEIKENVWKRWRGKVEKNTNNVTRKMAAEDLDKKIDGI